MGVVIVTVVALLSLLDREIPAATLWTVLVLLSAFYVLPALVAAAHEFQQGLKGR